MDPSTGYCRVPRPQGLALTDFVPPTSGVYLAKIVTSAGSETHVPFVVRDDRRARDVLVAMPTNTWLAYNNCGGKSSIDVGGLVDREPETVAGHQPGYGRLAAVKVSFDRPLQNQFSTFDWVLHTEFPLIYWLERMGYDVAYTEDVAIHRDPSQLLPANTKAFVDRRSLGVLDPGDVRRRQGGARRPAPTSRASAPTPPTGACATRTASARSSCYKTIQGTGPQARAAGATTAGRTIPVAPHDHLRATAARGRRRRGAARRPQRRLSQPENAGLRRALRRRRQRRVAPAQGPGGRWQRRRVRRPPRVAQHRRGQAAGARRSAATLVGWEWDAIPSAGALHALARSVQPAGVKRLAATDPTRLDHRPAAT